MFCKWFIKWNFPLECSTNLDIHYPSLDMKEHYDCNTNWIWDGNIDKIFSAVVDLFDKNPNIKCRI